MIFGQGKRTGVYSLSSIFDNFLKLNLKKYLNLNCEDL